MVDLIRAVLGWGCPWCRRREGGFFEHLHDAFFDRLAPTWWVMRPHRITDLARRFHDEHHLTSREYVSAALLQDHEWDCNGCFHHIVSEIRKKEPDWTPSTGLTNLSLSDNSDLWDAIEREKYS